VDKIRSWWADVSHRLAAKTIIVLFLIGAVWYDYHSGQAAQRIALCKAVNDGNAQMLAYVQEQLDRAKTTLPTLQYYKTHPDELQKALDNIKQQEKETQDAFGPVKC